MKKQEIKKLSKDEVIKNIDKLKKDLFNFRFQKMNSQITNPAKIGETRKTIARLISHHVYLWRGSQSVIPYPSLLTLQLLLSCYLDACQL